jgi:hypothetical protein
VPAALAGSVQPGADCRAGNRVFADRLAATNTDGNNTDGNNTDAMKRILAALVAFLAASTLSA